MRYGSAKGGHTELGEDPEDLNRRAAVAAHLYCHYAADFIDFSFPDTWPITGPVAKRTSGVVYAFDIEPDLRSLDAWCTFDAHSSAARTV